MKASWLVSRFSTVFRDVLRRTRRWLRLRFDGHAVRRCCTRSVHEFGQSNLRKEAVLFQDAFIVFVTLRVLEEKRSVL